jgi:tetratricopeptide (TPR) repeat protein
MQQLVNNRWFALADLLIVFAYGAVVTIWPQLGGWLIVLVMLPWLFRIVAGRLNIEKHAFIVPLALIVITAGIGVWAAYDRQAAWGKFWIIIGAVAVFTALVSQPKENLGVVASLVGLMGVIIAIIFMLNNDWNTQSSDLGVINRAGGWIMANRPSIGPLSLLPNIAGGLLAILVPIPFALGLFSWVKGDRAKAILSLAMGMVVLIGLFLTSSRGAWIALLLGMAVWVLLKVSVYLSVRIRKPSQLVFILLLLLLLIPVLWVIGTFPGGVVGLADRLPGLPSGESRLDLAVNTTKLIGDYPFTGGGLRSFAGLYSQYMMVTPYFLFAYSHNFYLDIFLEQGLLGGIAILAVVLGGAWMLIGRAREAREDSLIAHLAEAVFIGIVVMLLHGLVDDPLYGGSGTPLLLLLPALAIMLVTVENQPLTMTGQSGCTGYHSEDSRIKRIIIPGIVLIVFFSVVATFRSSLLSIWYANLGAVEMSHWELENWPQDQWNANPDVSPLAHSEFLFKRALVFSPYERTALHRSGLIAMRSRDFSTAQTDLERAFNIDPDHRGIRKSLGYAYVWEGDLENAERMLQGIREARDEMEVYSWWWGENNRWDLATQASEMVSILDTVNQ